MSKRFVTYRTEDAKAGLVNVDENGVMKHGGGSGLPTGGEPFKQLVTDADGNTVWADRLAWTVETNALLVDNKTLDFLEDRAYVLNPFELSIVVGGIYEVIFDGERYECVAYYDAGLPANAIGNMSILSPESENSGEPFFLFVLPDGIVVVYVKETGTHTISITGPVQEVKKINNMFLPEPIKPLIVTIEMDDNDNDNWVASSTFAEISEAILANRTVVCVRGDEMFHLMKSPALSNVAPMAIQVIEHLFVSFPRFPYIDILRINDSNSIAMQEHTLTYT